MSTNWSNQVILNRFHVDLRLPGVNEAYRAWDAHTNQAVALRLLPELPEDEISRQMENRGNELAHITHPGLSPCLGYFEFAAHAFWVEGYLDAPSLRDVLSSTPGQPLALTETLVYLKSLSAALAALHNAGWSHTDLRPEKIRVTRTGKIILGGLFAARRLGEIPPLTSRYTPPDKALSPAFDLYSLGLITYEMLAGSLPEPLPNLRQLNPNAPEFLARQLPRALDPYPSTRVGNATEFFLTACLACRVEAGNIPERIPLDSASASLLGIWDFLPPLEPPQTLELKGPLKEKRRLPAWGWVLIAAASLGVGISAWILSGKLNPPKVQEPLAATELPISAPVFNDLETASLPTATPVPTLEAPDGLGGKIVFTCTRDDLNQLCMVAPAGGEVVRVTSERAHNYYPAFSPAGNMLLYASNRDGNFELYLKLLGTDILARLTDNLGEVSSSAFSPDGSQVAFSNSVDGKPSGLWLVNKDGTNPQKIYESAGNIAGAVWSPNGKSLAFAMSSAEALQTYEVYIIDLETLTVGPVTKGHLPDAGGSVDWSPDGRSLLLFAGPPGDKNIFLFDIVSGHIRQLTNGGNNAAPVFSPDGRWIAFNSQRTGNADIFIMQPDGSDVRQLTDDPEPDWQPRWGR
jgi:serine/threonine protein kinase